MNVGSETNHTNTMYVRPHLKTRPGPKLQFVVAHRTTGATEAKWVPVYDVVTPIPNGTPGRVGEVVDMMRRGTDCVKGPVQTTWIPPLDYLFVAKHIADEQTRLNYISKCEVWFAEHPPPPQPVSVSRPCIDTELIMALFKKYEGQVPPFEERIKVYRAAGYPEQYITKAIERNRKLEETADARQKAIDDIFGKWPSAGKSVPKPKGKMIKAVKKRT